MSGGFSLAVGACWACSRRITFDPDDVASVYIDPVTGLPPEEGDTAGKLRAKRRELCYRCAKEVAEERLEHGLPDLWAGRWGTPPK